MKRNLNLLVLIVFLLSILYFNSIEVKAQSYAPVGPQTNVPVATVTNGGWTECYRDVYQVRMDSNTVLTDCPGELLMLACREFGSDTLMLLAQGNRSDVTFDTGNNSNVTHIANGVGWYFSTVLGSWGFVTAGEMVNKTQCDAAALTDNDRLCWHIQPVDDGGYRCGDALPLNSSVSFERIVYMPAPPQVTTAVPTLSEWGLIAMTAILGLAGFMVIRRRKASA